MSAFLGLLIFLYAVVFFIIQLIPNKRWFIISILLLGVLSSYIYYDTEYSIKEHGSPGDVFGLGIIKKLGGCFCKICCINQLFMEQKGMPKIKIALSAKILS